MKLSLQLSRQFKAVFFGGNWTSSNLKDHLKDVSHQQATTKIEDMNTILTLVYHINYYVNAALEVFDGRPLTAKDIYSFDHPPVHSREDWQHLLDRVWINAEMLTSRIEQLPEEQWWEDFADKKYGNYYRNITGIIEHTHYHLGQIVLLKKLVK